MDKGWKITNFERVIPSDPDHVWATFDVEFNSGDIARDVSILQESDGFRLSRLDASPDTKLGILEDALAKYHNC